jgi:hypothetical protein
MSNTKKQIILDAYANIGYSDYFYNEDAEQIDFALRILDRMLADWESVGISIGYNFDSNVQDVSGVPDYALNAIVSNLSMRLASSIGKQFSQDERQNAIDAYSNLKLKFLTIPILPRNNLIPQGQGARVYNTQSSNFLTN